MDTSSVIKALQEMRKGEKERKFPQTFDLIVSLKGLNMKKPEEQVDFYTVLSHGVGKKRSVCALVGPELEEKAKEACDLVISQADFGEYKNPKQVKGIARKFDYFVAQADIMPKVAQTFGRALGPRGKMPNPKAGCILPPKAPVQPIYDRLQKTLHILAKKQLAVQVPVGNQEMKDEEVADNIMVVYDQLIHHLPLEKNNVKSVMVKLTMGKPVVLE